MAKSKDDIKYAVGEARLSEDEGVRVGYSMALLLKVAKLLILPLLTSSLLPTTSILNLNL
ncbi:hypothetical protein CCACVL1_05214 [Corchorus capsularis]|uniref:Uncharacterized protein n=1 Tax=Corchorus capsularis TaxID=210143 RepID=A0A1R3JM13_COCAP|nr:hypothetical protein CCACVL1_05214 [Corchorus capsularis]